MVQNDVKIINTPIIIEKEMISKIKEKCQSNNDYLNIFREICGEELKELCEDVIKNL